MKQYEISVTIEHVFRLSSVSALDNLEELALELVARERYPQDIVVTRTQEITSVTVIEE